MPHTPYSAMDRSLTLDRREFVRALGTGAAVAGGVVLGGPAFAQEPASRPALPETNIRDFMAVPRGPHAIPGPFPGRVIRVSDPRVLKGDRVRPRVVRRMFADGITQLTGRSMKDSYRLFFEPGDVVGIKVNPVGPPLINTRLELVDAVIEWLTGCGLPADQIVVWDRFDAMMHSAGYTEQRFPGVRIAALQTMAEGNAFLGPDGRHISADNFDPDVFYFVKGVEGKGVRGYKDDEYYLNQHVFNGENSYFGTLVTRNLTKIINLAVYKNTGHGISMATKNLGYGALANTGRLHVPLSLRVNTEVLAAPCLRDRLVLNVIDGIRGQYEDGPMLNEQYVYPHHTLYFGTDPFAMDTVCHHELVAKRRAMGITVNEHPRFTDYLRYGEELGLGIADPARITVRRITA